MIQQSVRVMASNSALSGKNVVVGMVKVKMRMRTPLQEAARFFRQKQEIDDMKATHAAGGSDAGPRRKRINISVIGCSNLQSGYSASNQISPFFYYQFYTMEERYSHTVPGANPMFDDSQAYEVPHDHKLSKYLENEVLEIIVFDDNAPPPEASAAQQDVEDMIGTARIPL